MGDEETKSAVAEGAQHVAHDQGFFDALWGLLSSAMSAFTVWASSHWGAIALGLFAIVATMMATQLSKMILDWARSPNRKKPREMADDTHKLMVRMACLANGTGLALSLGFREHFGAATGLSFGWFEAGVIGGLMNSGVSVVIFHAWHWFWGPSKTATELRAIMRIKLRKRAGVTPKQIEDAKTTTGHPPITEDMVAADRAAKGLDDGE